MSGGFRTSLLHSCYSPDLNESRPKVCKCRKLVTRTKAIELVNQGAADWVISYDGPVPVPTWNIAYRGRQKMVPRVATLERAHIERSLERRDERADQLWLSDEGAMSRNLEAAAMGDLEQMELFELYHDLEIEERYNLFRGMRRKDDKGAVVNDLGELKKFSGTFGTVEGPEGKYVNDIIAVRADNLKNAVAVDDPYEGRPVFPLIGWDQRTSY